MTLTQYIAALNQIKKTHPESAKFEVVYSSDDEGNSHHKVYYTPSICLFNGSEVEAGLTEGIDIKKCNAVCIN